MDLVNEVTALKCFKSGARGTTRYVLYEVHTIVVRPHSFSFIFMTNKMARKLFDEARKK